MDKIRNKDGFCWYELKRLWKQFDPIGVYIAPSDWPDDEYDSYIVPTLRLLEEGVDFNGLHAYISSIVKEHMGMDSFNDEYIANFTRKLRTWYSWYSNVEKSAENAELFSILETIYSTLTPRSDGEYVAQQVQSVVDKAFYLEYFLLSNWSYADVRRMLLWRTGEKTRRILDIEDEDLSTLSGYEKAMGRLANSLLGRKNDMPLEHFVRFLIVLLSRIVQKNKRSIEVHTEELGLQQ